MSNEEMVKEAVEEAKKAAEAEAKEQEAKGHLLHTLACKSIHN